MKNAWDGATEVERTSPGVARMGKKKRILISIVGVFLTGATQVYAQDTSEESGVVYKKKTVVSFSGDTIDGDLTAPDAEYIRSREATKHSNLIRIRSDFRQRVLHSVSEL
jgi:hypothetical protein